MTVIASGDVTRARSARRVQCRPVLNLTPLRQVVQALVTANATYPLTQINRVITGDWDNIRVGQGFRVERPDGQIVTWGVLRRFSSTLSGIAFPDVKADGDGGYARSIGLPILENDILRVYEHHPAWSIYSRATAEDSFKAWDTFYNGAGTAPPPVCNIGPHRQVWVDPAGVARLTFDASASYDWLAGAGGITAYNWTLPDTATVRAGGTDQQTVTVDFLPGVHLIACEVTSVNGRRTTGYRWVWVNVDDQQSEHAPFSHRFAVVDIEADREDRHGREMTFTIRGDAEALASALHPGQMCHFAHPVTFDGQTINGATDSFIGHMDDYEITSDRFTAEARVRFVSPLKLAARMPTATQLVEETPSPRFWTEVRQGLSDPAHVAYYCMRYHATLLDLHDYTHDPGLRPLRREVYGVRQENIGGQLDFIGELAAGEINCRSDGEIKFIFEPNHLEVADKNALDDKFTWTDVDLRDPLDIRPRLRPDAAAVTLGGVSYDGATVMPYLAIAPGYAAAQGITRDTMTDVIVTPAGGQEKVERLVGHRFAYLNNPLAEMEHRPLMMLDILVPADDDWHRLALSSMYLPVDANRFGMDWNAPGGMRTRPTSVRREWSNERGQWQYEILAELRALSNGRRGRFLDVDPDGAWQWIDLEGFVADNDIYAQDDLISGLDEAYALAVAWNDQGDLARSLNFTAKKVTWGKLNNLAGNHRVLGAAWDYSAALPAVEILVYDASDHRLIIYRTPNAFATSPVSSVQRTINLDDTYRGQAMIKSNASVSCVVFATTTGTFAIRRTGSTWESAAARVGVNAADEDAGSDRLGLALVGSNQYVYAQTAAGEYALYTASGTGSWSLVDNHPGDDAVSASASPMIEPGPGSSLYITLDLDSSIPGEETIIQADLTNQGPGTPAINLPRISTDPAAQNIPTRYGTSVLYQTDEQIAGTDYTLDSITVRLTTELWWNLDDGDPPGNEGDPVYYPPGDGSGTVYNNHNVIFDMQFALLDKDGDILYAEPQYEAHALSLDDADLIYAPSPTSFNRIFLRSRTDRTFTPDEPLEGVRYLYFGYISQAEHTFGLFTTGAINEPKFQVSASLVGMTISNQREVGPRLFRLHTSSDTWTNVTPEEDRVPLHPAALSARTANIQTIVTRLNGTRQLIRSVNDGDTWTNRRITSYKWLRHLDSSVYLVGGPGRLDVTTDTLSSFSPRAGNWSSAVGTVGAFEGALVAIEVDE